MKWLLSFLFLGSFWQPCPRARWSSTSLTAVALAPSSSLPRAINFISKCRWEGATYEYNLHGIPFRGKNNKNSPCARSSPCPFTIPCSGNTWPLLLTLCSSAKWKQKLIYRDHKREGFHLLETVHTKNSHDWKITQWLFAEHWQENPSSAFPTAPSAETSLPDANPSALSSTSPISHLWFALTRYPRFPGRGFFTEEAVPFFTWDWVPSSLPSAGATFQKLSEGTVVTPILRLN